ncbi:M28 family peptidase [Pontimicrobium sp. SW4]|uniref:Carboxypeptidase Q n=1 Tax=Pontimicrobium sp. SW4 TaxID=3153519 RepID=A0AAU7BVN9_9FLAO
MKYIFSLFVFVCLSLTLTAQNTTDTEKNIADVIKKHGIENSQVMDIASYITDVLGQRLTGSTGLKNANEWAKNKLTKMGMQNSHLEQWESFGRGWDMTHFEMHAEAPTYWPIIAYPKAWSSPSKGSGEVIYLNATTLGDLDKYKGKLSGKFVMIQDMREVKEAFEATAKRHDSESLLNLANATAPVPRQGGRRFGGNASAAELRVATWKLLESEKPLAILDRSSKGDLGTVFVSGARTAEGSARDNDKYVVPQITVAIEHYNRIFRMLEKGIPVKLSIDSQSKYTNPDGNENNVIAEIPGTDLKDEVVMFGAHYDSWHAGTGATDNGAGSAVMMEAARILIETIKETGIKPRRTLRIALWTGEEQGLHGSRNYVAQNFANTGESSRSIVSLKQAQKKVSGYFNMDNGTGKLRGVYLQGNQAVSPIFREWLKPFHDMGASTLSLSNTGGTDHLAFDAVGIPGFQFIQEPISYSTKTHHSNMDNFDHLVADDLKQAATIIAYFIWQTSQRDKKLPRKEANLKYN